MDTAMRLIYISALQNKYPLKARMEDGPNGLEFKILIVKFGVRRGTASNIMVTYNLDHKEWRTEQWLRGWE